MQIKSRAFKEVKYNYELNSNYLLGTWDYFIGEISQIDWKLWICFWDVKF